MITINHSINNKNVIEINDMNFIIHNAQEFLETIYGLTSSDIIIHKENLTPDFFDLKTRVAGEILQKASNYRIRIGIVGDFKDMKSKSLKDFIYESNKTKEIIFKENIEEILQIFGK